MAEPPDTLHPNANPGGPDLLSTKLYVPRLSDRFVTRPRLVERLDEGLARGVTLVCAPAGFGKSVLLADWCRRSRKAIGWLSLDAGDNRAPAGRAVVERSHRRRVVRCDVLG